MKFLLVAAFSGLVALAVCQTPGPRYSNVRCNNCTMDQMCVERRISLRVVSVCVPRIMMGDACMKLSAEEPSRPREAENPIFARDIASRIEGVSSRECATNLICRNETCRAMPNTTCTRRKARESETSCDEDGMFSPRQCRRLRNETSSRRPTALICGCANRMTGQMSNTRIVRTRTQLPACSRSCNVTLNQKRIVVNHGDSISRPQNQNRECVACRCNNGRLDCTMLRNATCPTRQGQGASCRFGNSNINHGETKKDGSCNMCRCINGQLRCTDLPSCRDGKSEEKDDDIENDRMRCEACMSMPVSHVCVEHQGRTFPTRCHAMMCANVSEDQIVSGACRDNDACTNTRDRCGTQQRCFKTGRKTQMSNKLNRPESRRLCVDPSSVSCSATRTSADGMERVIERPSADTKDEDLLPRNMNSRNTLEEDRVVCGNSGMTFPSTCHMIAESSRSENQVRHPGPCRDIDASEMVCGTDGVTYRNMDIMQTHGGNVRMDYRGACMNASDNTVRNRCEMVRQNKRCPSMEKCDSRANTTDGCCPTICGGVVMVALDQSEVENQANTLPDLDTFLGRMLQNRTNDKMPVLPPDAARMCNISITKPAAAIGNVAEVVLAAKNMSMGKMCRMHAMNMANMLNQARDNANTEPITVPESVVAAATVAPELEDNTSGSIPVIASPILMLGLILLKVFFY